MRRWVAVTKYFFQMNRTAFNYQGDIDYNLGYRF